MIKKDCTTKTVETEFVESTVIICDRCGEAIAFYNVVMGHHDSILGDVNREKLNVCPQCLDKIVDEFKWRSLRCYNTEYLEINHMNTCDLIEEEE